MKERIHPTPLSTKGKTIILLIILGILAMWGFAIYAYLLMPKAVPAHFGISGEPTRYGHKSGFFILPIVSTIIPVLFLLLTKYRFTLINKYPNLGNFPTFLITNLPKISEEKRGVWINKYFESIILGTGFAFTIFFFIAEIVIFFGEIQGKLSLWFIVFSITMPVWLILALIFYLRKFKLEMLKEIKEIP